MCIRDRSASVALSAKRLLSSGFHCRLDKQGNAGKRFWGSSSDTQDMDRLHQMLLKDGDVTDMSFSAYSVEDGKIVFDNVGWYLSLERFDGTPVSYTHLSCSYGRGPGIAAPGI